MNRTLEYKLEITEYLIPGAEGGLAQQPLHPCELKFLHKLSCIKVGQIEAGALSIIRPRVTGGQPLPLHLRTLHFISCNSPKDTSDSPDHYVSFTKGD